MSGGAGRGGHSEVVCGDLDDGEAAGNGIKAVGGWWRFGSSSEVGEWSCRLGLTSWSGVGASSCIYEPNGGGIEFGGELWMKIESSAVCLVMARAVADSGARARERSQGGARWRDTTAAGGGMVARHSGSSRRQAHGRAATALPWSPALMRRQGPWVARSPLRASGGGATDSALAHLPPTRRRDSHPPCSPGELAGGRRLELEDRAWW